MKNFFLSSSSILVIKWGMLGSQSNVVELFQRVADSLSVEVDKPLFLEWEANNGYFFRIFPCIGCVLNGGKL